jgi:transposase
MGRAPTRVRRTFTPQFKRDAVRLVVDEGKSLTEVATHLGIARSLLQRWREQRTAAPHDAFPGNGRLPASAQRVRELEQQLRAVTQERDILKKALAYFVTDPK